MRRKQSLKDVKKKVKEVVRYLKITRRVPEHDVFRYMVRSDDFEEHVVKPLAEIIEWDDEKEKIKEQAEELTNEVRKTTSIMATITERYHAAVSAIGIFFRRKKHL
ncbi:MAG: hypothetical protein AAB581_03815 [Patescibacteria group bacterium]